MLNIYGKYGQSMYDLCLMAYGTLDLFVKFCADNNITDVNYLAKSGDVFIYDQSLVVDEGLLLKKNIYNTASQLPVIISQPANLSIPIFTNGIFNIAATNVTAYQWQYNTGAGWINIVNGSFYSGGTTASLNVLNAPYSENGYLYRCVVSNIYGYTISSTASLTIIALILDIVSGSATAYGLRKLKAGYAGYAINVRRASDNTAIDIGFVGNLLDIPTLTSFISGTTGYIVTFYDLTGNGNHVIQNTAVKQPQVVIVSSKAHVLWIGASQTQYLKTAGAVTALNSNTSYTTIAALSLTNVNRTQWMYGTSDGNLSANFSSYATANLFFSAGLEYNFSNQGVNYAYGHPTTYPLTNGVLACVTSRYADGNNYADMRKNGSNLTMTYDRQIPTHAKSSQALYVGAGFTGATLGLDGELDELIVFSSSLSDINTSLVENDIINFYGIS